MAIPVCPYFGTCGGCSAQHIDYSAQLENKKQRLSHLLKTEIKTVVGSEPYSYRNRMDFVFHPGGIGLRKKGVWHTIVDINACSISDATINGLVAEVRTHFSNVDVFDLRKQRGTFRYCLIRTTTTNESCISFVLNQNSTQLEEATQKIERFAKITKATHVVVTYVPAKTDESTSAEYFVVKGNDMLTDELAGKTFTYSVQGFFQNNPVMAEKMLLYVKEKLSTFPSEKTHLLDVYGGVGTFGIVCGESYASTTIVESLASCIDAAKINIEKNNALRTSAHVLDASALHKLKIGNPLHVITDPPRSGMHQKAIKNILELKPSVIVYISCNPEQLAKELHFFEQEYTLQDTALFDLFPQTNHMEAIVTLVRKI